MLEEHRFRIKLARSSYAFPGVAIDTAYLPVSFELNTQSLGCSFISVIEHPVSSRARIWCSFPCRCNSIVIIGRVSLCRVFLRFGEVPALGSSFLRFRTNAQVFVKASGSDHSWLFKNPTLPHWPIVGGCRPPWSLLLRPFAAWLWASPLVLLSASAFLALRLIPSRVLGVVRFLSWC